MTDPAPYRRPYPNTQPEYLFPKYASTVKGEPSASASSAVAAMAEVLQGLEIDTAAMRANVERLRARLGADAGAESGHGAAAMIERALAMWRETAP